MAWAETRAEVVWEETIPSANGPQQMRRHITPVFAADGTLRMMVGTGSNVTQRRLAELKLEEQRQFYEMAMAHIPCDIGVSRRSGEFELTTENTDGSRSNVASSMPRAMRAISNTSRLRCRPRL